MTTMLTDKSDMDMMMNRSFDIAQVDLLFYFGILFIILSRYL